MHAKHFFLVKNIIDKYHKVGFIEPIDYSSWLANIITTLNPNGEIKCCTYFKDLNNTYPKDNFPLPHINIIIDSTVGHNILSFMDDF